MPQGYFGDDDSARQPQESTHHEQRAAKEMEDWARIDEEKEERLERLRRRQMEWKARRVQKAMDMNEEAMV